MQQISERNYSGTIKLGSLHLTEYYRDKIQFFTSPEEDEVDFSYKDRKFYADTYRDTYKLHQLGRLTWDVHRFFGRQEIILNQIPVKYFPEWVLEYMSADINGALMVLNGYC